MPNWCNNSVTITHKDPAKITQLADAFVEERFCDHVIPVPEILKDLTTTNAAMAASGFESWYDFCVARWGTKWDVGGADATMDIENDGCTLSVSFESAWSPPLGVYEELVAQGYDVVAHYWESSMGFVGRWINGDDLCYDYSSCTSETVRGYIGDELDDYFNISEQMTEWEDENCDEVTRWYKDGVEETELNPHKVN